MTHAVEAAAAPAPAATTKNAALSSPAEPAERAAEALARRVTAGERVAPRVEVAHRLDRTRIQRQVADPAPAGAPGGGLLVEDDQTPSAGQMRKGAFLDELYTTLCRTVESGFQGTPYEGRGCPFLERAITAYRHRSAADGEAMLRRWAGEVTGVATAAGYVPVIERRVRRSVAVFVATGEITGVPDELRAVVTGGGFLGGLMSGGLSGGIASALGMGLSRLFFKERAGETPPAADPATVRSRLGSGHALDSGVQARMERAYGWSFSHVRIHNDEASGRVAEGLAARAFTVGRDIAFASGEYRPGTLAGDALIAHELAHVVQQGPGTADAPTPGLEADADEAAAGALLGGGARGRKRGRPRRRGALQLLRCNRGTPACTPGNVRDVPVQPVFFRTGPDDAAPTGRTWERRMRSTRSIWAKLGVRFAESAAVVQDDATRKTQGTTDAELASIAGSRSGDGVEAFFVDNDLADSGGGATLHSGDPGPNSKIVLSDRGSSNTLLAHEMGHVLGLKHPGAGTPYDADPGTVMEPSDSNDNENPPRNTLLNAERMRWPAGAPTCINPDT